MAVRGRKARKRLSPEQRREEIISAAHRVFAVRDPAAVTFEEIAAQAGVSRALVYNYFGDKGSLLAAVYEHALADLDAELVADLGAEVTLDERLGRVVGHYATFAQSRADSWQLLGHVAATPHPAVRAARRARIEALGAALGGTTRHRLAAAALLGLLEEVLSQWLEQADVPIEELVATVSALLCSGFGALLASRVGEFVS